MGNEYFVIGRIYNYFLGPMNFKTAVRERNNLEDRGEIAIIVKIVVNERGELQK